MANLILCQDPTLCVSNSIPVNANRCMQICKLPMKDDLYRLGIVEGDHDYVDSLIVWYYESKSQRDRQYEDILQQHHHISTIDPIYYQTRIDWIRERDIYDIAPSQM